MVTLVIIAIELAISFVSLVVRLSWAAIKIVCAVLYLIFGSIIALIKKFRNRDAGNFDEGIGIVKVERLD